MTTNKTQVSIYFPKDMYVKLVHMSMQQGESISLVVRNIVRDALKDFDHDAQVQGKANPKYNPDAQADPREGVTKLAGARVDPEAKVLANVAKERFPLMSFELIGGTKVKITSQNVTVVADFKTDFESKLAGLPYPPDSHLVDFAEEVADNIFSDFVEVRHNRLILGDGSTHRPKSPREAWAILGNRLLLANREEEGKECLRRAKSAVGA